MPPALSPALALDYVRELSADVRAGLVLDAAGQRLAGDERLEAHALALLASVPHVQELEAVSPAGVVCAVRGQSHAIVAVCGPFALPAIVRADLRVALGALEAAPLAPPEDVAASADDQLRVAADGLIAALQQASQA